MKRYSGRSFPTRRDAFLEMLRWHPILIALAAVVLYTATAIVFAAVYHYATNQDGSRLFRSTFGENDGGRLRDAVHFSFTTQATVGYGDFRPVGRGRWIAAGQSGLGILQIGMFPAVLVFRALKRPLTVRLASRICVTEQEDGRWVLWLRWVNPGPSDLFEFRIVVLVATSTQGPPYDTEALAPKLAYNEVFLLPPHHVFLVHSEPFELRKDRKWRFQANIVATLGGTGERKSFARWYSGPQIVIGRYAYIDGRLLLNRSAAFKRRLIARRLDRCKMRSVNMRSVPRYEHSGSGD